MGIGKPQLRAKFEVARFIYNANIRESVLNDTFAFWANLWGVRGNVRTSSIARWKARSRLPIRDTIIELFASSYGWRTSTSKASLLKGVGHFGLKIRFKVYIYRQHIYAVRQGNGFATTLPLEIFTQRNFVAEFVRFKLIFIHKNDKFTFWATLWGTYIKLHITHQLSCT